MFSIVYSNPGMRSDRIQRIPSVGITSSFSGISNLSRMFGILSLSFSSISCYRLTYRAIIRWRCYRRCKLEVLKDLLGSLNALYSLDFDPRRRNGYFQLTFRSYGNLRVFNGILMRKRENGLVKRMKSTSMNWRISSNFIGSDSTLRKESSRKPILLAKLYKRYYM